MFGFHADESYQKQVVGRRGRGVDEAWLSGSGCGSGAWS